jgi:hypothetical protein
MNQESEDPDPEIIAITAVHAALRSLPADAQDRVLRYVAAKLRREVPSEARSTETSQGDTSEERASAAPRHEQQSAAETEDDGISDAGKKWVRRNGLDSTSLGTVFSLGVDDIEVVANKIPGKAKKDRMRNVILLKGVAAYLSGGVARLSHAELKETCLHYDAYDEANSTKYIKAFASDVSGSAKSGYTLTSRGLASATELIKSMLGTKTGQ